MKGFKIFSILLAGSIALAALNAHADSDILIDQFKTGGYILMIRHAMAPGTGDPVNFQIGDCATRAI